MQVVEASERNAAARLPKVKKIKESERACEAVKQLIVRLELPPGAVIEEAQLRQRVGVGRTPMREALYRLADLGLVVIVPHRGFFVADLLLTDLQHLCEMRLLLEGTSARLAAERAEGQIVAVLRDLLGGTAPAIRASDLDQMISIDLSFHRTIAHASGNRFLEEAVQRYSMMMLRFWYFSLSKGGHLVDIMHEHLNILSAIEQRDSVSAEAAMRYHVLEFRNKVRALL